MSALKAPSINISFIEKAISAIARGERGILAIAIKQNSPTEPFVVTTVTDIPTGLSDFNKTQIKNALIGYVNAPKKILVYEMKNSEEDLEEEYNKMLDYFGTSVWNYLVIPTVETDGKVADVASWIKSQRTNNKKSYKAVLPNTTADGEGVINVTSSFVVDETTFTPEQSCSRVAGIIAGTPLTISCTYAPIPEASDCTRVADEDTAVGQGKLIFTNDGEKVKIVRGVNSFVTTTDSKGDQFKKIKIVEIMDMISDDIRKTAQDSYLGKYANSYDNKCLLITAINAYLARLAADGLLSGGYVELDIEAMSLYFQSKGGLVKLEDGSTKPLEDCSEAEIKTSNTGTYVHLMGHISILDAIEDIELPIYI